METIKQILADRMRDHREKLGLTQGELAVRADVSKRAIQQIEQKHRWPSPENISKIAVALECSVSDLLLDLAPKVAPTPSRIPRDIREGLEQCDDIGFEMVRTILRGRGNIGKKQRDSG